jgi:hypothetical protein
MLCESGALRKWALRNWALRNWALRNWGSAKVGLCETRFSAKVGLVVFNVEKLINRKFARQACN